MGVREKLQDFAGALAIASTDAPDAYPSWSYTTYESNRAELLESWGAARTGLKRDLDQVAFIDRTLQEAIAAFDAGDKETGRKAIWAIYNLGVKRLR